MESSLTLRQKFYAFWPLFISTHLDPWNRRMHLLGNLWMFSCAIAAAVTQNWILLLIAFTGYMPSWLGHFFFEKNIPITFKGPFLSALCDLKMIGLMLAQELDPELLRLFGTTKPAVGSPVLHDAQHEIFYQEQTRLRINQSIQSHPFTDYWDIFLMKHQRGINIWIHALAIVYLYVLTFYILYTQNFFLVIFIPLSPIAGLISHALFERNHIDFEDALFSRRAFLCLNRLTLGVFTGKYWRELASAKQRLKTWNEEGKQLHALV